MNPFPHPSPLPRGEGTTGYKKREPMMALFDEWREEKVDETGAG